MPIGCIYLALNTVNGKGYIGKSKYGLSARRTGHLGIAHRTTCAFHKALQKYGRDAFEWRELYVSDIEEALFAAEIELIAAYRASGMSLYNMSDGGEGPSGYVRTKEHRQALSSTRQGMKFSDEHRAALVKSRKGRKMPPWTAERRAKMEAAWERGSSKKSEAHKAKISATKRAAVTDELREKLREQGRKGAAARWTKAPVLPEL
jgi:group I intron endonuclease